MAKCGGCGGNTCGCSVVGGTGVSITGKGTLTNPLVITATGAQIQVTDTDTIDLTITGSGIPTDPYVLSGEYVGELPIPDQQPSETATWGATPSLASVTGPRTIRATLGASITSLTLPTWPSNVSGTITLVLRQDGAGNRTWVMPGVSSYGVDIVLSTAANATDIITATWTGAQWVLTPVAMAVA